MLTVSPPSVQSLLLNPAWDGKALGTATGFVVLHERQPYLITNWHVVSGRNADTNELLSDHGVTPDAVTISHLFATSPQVLGWIEVHEPLYKHDGSPCWLEHPKFGRKVDVVALPLTNLENVQLVPYSFDEPEARIKADVSDFVNIVGFPFGVTVGGRLAVWVKGAIASEMGVDFDERPCFLIDARTRRGQSGSPVIAYATGNVTLADGFLHALNGPLVNLLGVYSGRINSESDLGRVWKRHLIAEIVGSRRIDR
jgi:hypothetical protein